MALGRPGYHVPSCPPLEAGKLVYKGERSLRSWVFRDCQVDHHEVAKLDIEELVISRLEVLEPLRRESHWNGRR